MEALRFFHTEYRLDHLISVYPKPVITVMDGIVMGGGVGISAGADLAVTRALRLGPISVKPVGPDLLLTADVERA